MTNQPPLNPDAVSSIADVILRHCGGYVDTTRADAERAAKAVLRSLAAALPEVTGEQVNLAGWTCDGIHEPGSYATCEDCRGACDDLANFYNNMMQQPKANRSWTGRPAVKP